MKSSSSSLSVSGIESSKILAFGLICRLPGAREAENTCSNIFNTFRDLKSLSLLFKFYSEKESTSELTY